MSNKSNAHLFVERRELVLLYCMPKNINMSTKLALVSIPRGMSRAGRWADIASISIAKMPL